MRYYLPATGRAHWFLAMQGGPTFSRSHFPTSGGDRIEFKVSGFTLGAGPGLTYFLGPRVALEGQLTYNFLRVRAKGFEETVEQQSALGLNLGIQVFLGGGQ